MALQWDQLATYDETGAPQFRLAESITANEDATEWTVKLREGVTWSDGEPFTADDVLFTWKFNANPNQSYNSGLWAKVVGHAEWAGGRGLLGGHRGHHRARRPHGRVLADEPELARSWPRC